jgi:hypothetical protein
MTENSVPRTEEALVGREESGHDRPLDDVEAMAERPSSQSAPCAHGVVHPPPRSASFHASPSAALQVEEGIQPGNPESFLGRDGRSFDHAKDTSQDERKVAHRRPYLSSCQDDFLLPTESAMPLAATHFYSHSSWAAAPLPCAGLEFEEHRTRISRTSALSSFLTGRYHLTCTTKGGKLDGELPAVGMREIMYSSRNGTVQAVLKEPKFRWVAIVVGALMILHCIPSIILWRQGPVQEALHFRFTALELRGAPSSTSSPPDHPGVGSFGLRLGRCNMPLTDSVITVSANASITLSFRQKQAMDGWFFTQQQESMPAIYPSRFLIEASNDEDVNAASWRTVGAAGWTAVRGWYDFNLNARSDGRFTWDLAPSFAWLVGQTFMPLAGGVLLLVGVFTGMKQHLAVTAEFCVYASGIVTMLLSSWSAGHLFTEKSVDLVAMAESLIFAVSQSILVVSVFLRPKYFFVWLLACGILLMIGNFTFLLTYSYVFSTSSVRWKFVAGVLLNLMNVSCTSWVIASADKLVAEDKEKYAQLWFEALHKHKSGIKRLKDVVHNWNESAVITGKPKYCRQLNSKRQHVKAGDDMNSEITSERGGFYQFSDDRDPDSPVTSLDQVR